MICTAKYQGIKSAFTKGRPWVSEKEGFELENICEVIYYRREFKENISITQNSS